MELFDKEFFDSLKALQLRCGRAGNMALSGLRKSSAKGIGTEFSDFREYIPGDDIRRLDWNAYGRLGKLYLKQYAEEKEITFTIYLDLSESVLCEEEKLFCELRTTAIIGYMALHGGDRLRIVAGSFGQESEAVFHGNAAFPKVTAYLTKLAGRLGNDDNGDHKDDLFEKCRRYAPNRRGVSILISDFYPKEETEWSFDEMIETIKELRYFRNQEVMMFQVLSRAELEPAYTGNNKLIDAESGNSKTVMFEQIAFKEYQKALKGFITRIGAFADRYGIYRQVISAEESPEQIIRNGMGRGWT